MQTNLNSIAKPDKQSQNEHIVLNAGNRSANKVKTGEKLAIVGLAFAAIFWIFESIVDVILFGKGSFIGQLLTPGLYEIWMRTLVICTLIMFGVFTRSIIAERRRAEYELRIKDCAIASSINAIAMADLEGNLTYVNDSFLKLWRYNDSRDVLRRPATEFWQISE